MARLARLVIPGCPHHVTQRGNRGLETFLQDEDYAAYKELLSEYAEKAGVRIWAYCLMPNQVHFIMVPKSEDGLRGALAETHRRHGRRINRRQGWGGHLWRDRFTSFPMDGKQTLAAARAIELNPVRAGLVRQARTWPWSSAKAHLKGADDDLVTVAPLLSKVNDWKAFLKSGVRPDELEVLHHHERSGRPLGANRFVTRLEKLSGRSLRAKKRGRPPRKEGAARPAKSAKSAKSKRKKPGRPPKRKPKR